MDKSRTVHGSHEDKHVQQDAWHGHRVHAVGTHSSEAMVITRMSSYTLFVVTTTSSDFAIQLPLVHASTAVTADSTTPLPASAVAGDVVDVCVAPGSPAAAYVWYGATEAEASRHYDQVDPGKCRMYRYVAGSVWNRYT